MNDATTTDGRLREAFACLCVHDAGAAPDFNARAFGARELFPRTEPGARIGHAEMRLGPAIVMLSDEIPEFGVRGPLASGGTSATLHPHVDDGDAMASHAVSAGATMLRPPRDEFYGERSLRLRDAFGHEWLLGQEIERVSPEEMQRRYTALPSGA